MPRKAEISSSEKIATIEKYVREILHLSDKSIVSFIAPLETAMIGIYRLLQ